MNMKELTLKAMAKVNLGLDVLRKREDGYHDLRMVMQSVYLYDKIRMTVKAEPGIVLRTNLRYLPTGADNLVCRAAQLLIDEFAFRAKEAKDMGFDMCTFYMSYRSSILACSMSPLLNQRTDKYGGKTMAERATLAKEVFSKVKEVRRLQGPRHPNRLRSCGRIWRS